MARRTPNPHSPEEVRRAFQKVNIDTEVITSGDAGEILVGVGSGAAPTWTTELITLTLLTVDNITVNGAMITSDTGAISFGNENLTTTGSYTGVNVTSGENPGHTHTGSSLSGIDISDDTNLAVTSPIVLTDDTLSLDQSTIDHGSIGGLGDDDHSIYSLVDGTRAFSGTVGGITPVASADLTTKDYVDTAVDGAVPQFDAEIDSDGSAGMVVYSVDTGNVDLAYADGGDSEWDAVGLLDDDYTATDTATILIGGSLTLTTWAAALGSQYLTPGTTYYLAEQVGESPDYSNTGGTGDRTGIITASTTATFFGTPPTLVNGNKAENVLYFSSGVMVDKYIRFDFGSGVSKRITEAKWYQSTAATHGTWQWQGSDDAASWTNIGSTFTLGGTTEQTITELSGNGVGYRYYQLYGTAGAASNSPWLYEIEFKIAEYAGNPYGRITATAPTDSPTIRIGKAISTTTLSIEIDYIWDHGELHGLADDDHSSYHTDGRAATWLAANHETTYNHANYSTAYGWGDHSLGGYLTAESDTLNSVTGRGASTVNAITVGSLTNSALTSGRVVFAGASGLLADNTYLAFDGALLSSRSLSFGASTSSTVGVLKQGTDVIYNTYGGNVFIGKKVGNFTLSTATANLGIGGSSLTSLTTGAYNFAFGFSCLSSCTDGWANVAIGITALAALQSGSNNTAVGTSSLHDATGHYNTAIGVNAGYTTTGNGSIFIGLNAGRYETAGNKLYIDNAGRTNEATARAQSLIYGLFHATPASQYLAINGDLEPLALTAGRVVYSAAGTVNAKLIDSEYLTYDGTALATRSLTIATSTSSTVGVIKQGTSLLFSGYNSNLFFGTTIGNFTLTGTRNLGFGGYSFTNATSGSYNCAFGYQCLSAITTGQGNLAIGYGALNHATTGSYNFGVGSYALQELTTGGYNIALGPYAGNSVTTSDKCIFLGFNAGSYETGSNKLYINIFDDWEDANEERENAMAYGAFNTTVASQTLRLNAKIGVNKTPTAWLTIRAGSKTANTAPLKLTAGTNLTTPEAGAIEFDGTNLYFTDSTNTRQTLAVV